MAEENTDANTGTEAEGAGPSPDTETAVELEPIVDDDGLVSTVEYQTVEKKDDAEDADPSEGAEQNTPDGQSSEKQDFHEHPRFKELVEEKNKLKEQLEALTKTDDEEAQPPQVNFKNIMDMDDEAIVEQFSDNPKGFLSNLALQISHEIKTDLRTSEMAKREKFAEMTTKQKMESVRNEFFSDKEDGQAMLEDGRIKAFIEANPGHNEMSAYHALAGETNLKSKIESAVKQAEERIYKELKAAGKARSTATNTGSGILNPGKSPEMQNPGKFGGTENVLLKRLLARQS